MLIPVNGGILVKKIDLQKGKIVIPEGVGKADPVIAEIVAVCEDYVANGTVRKPFVNVGDKVIYLPQYAINFEVDGEKQTLVYITQILAVIKE